jgi:hypothetical protein
VQVNLKSKNGKIEKWKIAGFLYNKSGEKVGAGGCGLAKAGLRKVRAPEKSNLLGNAQCERS